MSDADEIACVLVPLHARQLLLPGVTVAEVVRMQRIRPVKTTPDWHLGLVPWRGVIVPVLSIDHMLAEPEDTIPAPRGGNALLIMNRTRVMKGLSFYALLVRALPRMLWISAEEMEGIDGPLASLEAGRVLVGQEEAMIPRLAFLEELVLQHRLAPRV
ncbi:MAG TPA: chemotaxis protein CheW [Pseudomonadales bacterium]|nr:chemotaxis protein CheW [Pseudomonadales bacterium]